MLILDFRTGRMTKFALEWRGPLVDWQGLARDWGLIGLLTLGGLGVGSLVDWLRDRKLFSDVSKRILLLSLAVGSVATLGRFMNQNIWLYLRKRKPLEGQGKEIADKHIEFAAKLLELHKSAANGSAQIKDPGLPVDMTLSEIVRAGKTGDHRFLDAIQKVLQSTRYNLDQDYKNAVDDLLNSVAFWHLMQAMLSKVPPNHPIRQTINQKMDRCMLDPRVARQAEVESMKADLSALQIPNAHATVETLFSNPDAFIQSWPQMSAKLFEQTK